VTKIEKAVAPARPAYNARSSQLNRRRAVLHLDHDATRRLGLCQGQQLAPSAAGGHARALPKGATRRTPLPSAWAHVARAHKPG